MKLPSATMVALLRAMRYRPRPFHFYFPSGREFRTMRAMWLRGWVARGYWTYSKNGPGYVLSDEGFRLAGRP